MCDVKLRSNINSDDLMRKGGEKNKIDESKLCVEISNQTHEKGFKISGYRKGIRTTCGVVLFCVYTAPVIIRFSHLLSFGVKELD